MSFSSENLLKQLDQSEIIRWSLELNNRKEAFSFLVQAVKSGNLNKHQFINAIHMLFRMAFPENVAEVVQILADVSGYKDIEIRSEAVQLAIGLIRLSASLKTPTLFSPPQESLIRDAMKQGLTPTVADLARDYFSK
jgi:hypothetical protein